MAAENYQALMNHYAMQPTWNNLGVSHENGDVEQSHFRFKQALDGVSHPSEHFCALRNFFYNIFHLLLLSSELFVIVPQDG